MKQKPQNIHILKSHLVSNNHFEWENLEVKRTAEMGDGVFARGAIPKSSFLPYYGPMWKQTKLQERAIDSLPDNYMLGATILLPWAKSYFNRDYNLAHATMDVYVDGNPDIETYVNPNGCRIGLKGLAIAAKINEPPPGKNANCLFVDYISEIRNVPISVLESQPIRLWANPLVMTTKNISDGDQLYVCYGNKYQRGLSFKPYQVSSECHQ